MRQEQTYMEHLLLLNVSELLINWWMMLYVSERECVQSTSYQQEANSAEMSGVEGGRRGVANEIL